jgi:N-acetylneuraminate synthase
MHPLIQIGKRQVGAGRPCYIVAEIGINHNGSVEIARQLIDAAIASGCDAVKFQKRTIDVVYTADELAKPRENPFGPTNGDLKRGLEFGEAEYAEIGAYCREKGIDWFVSCWDEQSVDFIERFSPVCYKIASASLTDDALLRHHRRTGRPIIASTGMSTMEEIEHAVGVLGRADLVLMHTTSNYPSPPNELNLLMVQTLAQKFGVPVGYSGHEVGLATSYAAAVLGASVIERHITLDRAMWGSDQAASVEPGGLARLVRDIREYEIAAGDGVKRIYESEVPIMKKLRRVSGDVAARRSEGTVV